MRDIDDLFAALARSRFRSKFALGEREQFELTRHGPDVIRAHAEQFIRKRLAPARPAADGKQTPMAGHPVFVAQHATATCCRGCLAKWHGIAPGHPLDETEQTYVCDVIMAWLSARYDPDGFDVPRQMRLF